MERNIKFKLYITNYIKKLININLEIIINIKNMYKILRLIEI